MVPLNLPVGTTVFAVDRHNIDRPVHEAKTTKVIQSVHADENSTYAINASPYSWDCPVSRLFLTKQEAVDVLTKSREEHRNELVSRLQTKEELVKELLDFVHCESATSIEIQVFREKANEYFGISIED